MTVPGRRKDGDDAGGNAGFIKDRTVHVHVAVGFSELCFHKFRQKRT